MRLKRKPQRMRHTPANAVVADMNPGTVLHIVKSVQNALETFYFQNSVSLKEGQSHSALSRIDWPEWDLFVGMVSRDKIQAELEDPDETDGHPENGDTWLVSLQINWAIVALRIDTGAQANLISMTEIDAMKEKPKTIKSSTKGLQSQRYWKQRSVKKKVTVKNKFIMCCSQLYRRVVNRYWCVYIKDSEPGEKSVPH